MFGEIKKTTIALEVARQIRRLILNGHIKPSQKLPPERELASRFGTNRNTLREAIRLLEGEGLVKVRQGEGTEVLDFAKTGSLALLQHYLEDVEDTSKKLMFLADAVALRREALGMVAMLAASRHSDEDAEKIRSALSRVEQAVLENQGVALADLEFFKTIAFAAGSMVLGWLVNTVVEVFKGLLAQGNLFVMEENYLENMRQIAEAVLSRNAENAKAKVLEHFQATDKVLLEKLKGVS
jgi:GntR family transcriptional repressor for pyruvate dehydrogenase complex